MNDVRRTTYPTHSKQLVETFDAVFTAEECQQFIDVSEQKGYEAATITLGRNHFELRTEVRNNDRVIYDDPQLAEQLFVRLRDLLPAKLHGWDLVGLNERFRFYRYQSGQTFKPHWDGIYARSDWESSQLSLLIYLSADFVGGETIFYQDTAMRKPCLETRQAVVVPQQGQVLIFEHQQLHEGAPVTSGIKYVLRTDVMYKHPLAK
ncbi:MAG: 2OG-Fe(II) oxygenase [Moraxellaceae bacterium]